MNRTIEQSYCCLAVNADSASNRLLSYSITLSLDIFSSFPPVDSYQASGGVATNMKAAVLMCRTVCTHGKGEGGFTYGDLSNFKAKYGKPGFIRLPYCF